MPTTHSNASKSRAKAPPAVAGKPKRASAAKASRGTKDATAKAESVTADPPSEKRSSASKGKSKWVKGAASPAAPRKAASRRSGAKALDTWVNTAPAEPKLEPTAASDAAPAPVAKPVFGRAGKRAAARIAERKSARALKAGAPAAPEPVPATAPTPPAPAARGKRAATAAKPAPKRKAEVESTPAAARRARTVSSAPARAPAETPSRAEAPKSAKSPVKPAKAPEAVAVAAKAQPAPAASAAPAPAKETPLAAAAPSSAEPKPVEAAKTAQPAAETFGFGLPYPMPNFDALSRNIAAAMEHAGKAFAAYLRPRENGAIKTTLAEEIAEMIRSLGHVAEYYMADPKRAIAAQTAFATQFINLWGSTLQRFQGQAVKPIAEPAARDKRFSDTEWKENPFFDFLKQAYVLTTDWAEDLVKHADEMEPHARAKAQFYLKQVTAALAPSNFIGTNPELLRATLAESGENLARGLKMLAEDIEAGKGNIRIRQVDARAFKLGVNMATTPGKVVFRNDLIELIQYEPSTPQVYKRPLLIFPPWINKFYILDLNPEKSFIRWAVAQGLTVFVVSWVNPDARLAKKGFDAYMREGILTALDKVEEATGERKVSAIGYCVGGTLLGATLGYMAAVGDDRIDSVTFLTTQIDFTDAGDLKVFVDAEQLKQTEARMAELGYLEGAAMANAFNMLRPNDLIWSYYINNYLKGKEPMPFDLLVWNADATRMPAANHAFYLRHCYYQNDLSNGRMMLGGKAIDLKKVKIPIYELAAKEDHIAPARSAFNGAKCFSGPVRYVMSGSGHIAGVVNPPAKGKYQYWSGGPPAGEFEDWVKAAKETPGSWWPDWLNWLTAQAPEKVPARHPGDGNLKPIGDAPGEYVRVKS